MWTEGLTFCFFWIKIRSMKMCRRRSTSKSWGSWGRLNCFPNLIFESRISTANCLRLSKCSFICTNCSWYDEELQIRNFFVNSRRCWKLLRCVGHEHDGFVHRNADRHCLRAESESLRHHHQHQSQNTASRRYIPVFVWLFNPGSQYGKYGTWEWGRK